MMTEEGVGMDREEIIDDLLGGILIGIDDQETDSKYGWWETSTGAEFGSKKINELADYIIAREEQAKKDAVCEKLQTVYNFVRKLWRSHHTRVGAPENFNMNQYKETRSIVGFVGSLIKQAQDSEV